MKTIPKMYMFLHSVDRGFRGQWQRMEIMSCLHEHARAGMALIDSFVVVYIRSDSCNLCISALKLSTAHKSVRVSK